MKRNVRFLFFSFFLCSCEIFKFSNGVLEDSQKMVIHDRQFINDLEFIGVVKNKEVVDGKFSLLMDQLQLKNQSALLITHAYYSINNHTNHSMQIFITKDLYDSLISQDTVIKQSGTDSVIVRKRSFRFYDW